VFGTLKPQKCSLPIVERDAYESFYCGLCKSLGDGFGQASRALVSHDAVFLALLVDALSSKAAQPDKCRCPLLPVVHRPTVEPGGVAMRFASAVEILLGDQYLADRALEGKALAKLARPISRRYVDRAEERLAGLGIDFSGLRDFEVRQAACEHRGRTRPADAAAPTADALAFVLGTIADLPGVGDAARTDAARAALARLGTALGEIIYFADALDDLEKDFEKGDFNPCIGVAAGRPTVDPGRVEETAALLRGALSAAKAALDVLPLARHREILESIVDDRLPRAARIATAAARRAADVSRRAERERVASLSWDRRLLHHAAVLVAFLMAWFFGESSTAAQTTARPKPPPKPSASTSASAAPSASAPFTPIPDAPSATPPPTTSPEPPAPKQDPATGKTIPAEEPAPPATGCDNPCQSCGSGCDSCTKGCSDTCSKCGGCGDCCKSCGDPCKGCGDSCKSCGDPCKGCGNCCSGCGDPCKGCCDCKGCDCGGGGCC
jgi:hypothetical protein